MNNWIEAQFPDGYVNLYPYLTGAELEALIGAGATIKNLKGGVYYMERYFSQEEMGILKEMIRERRGIPKKKSARNLIADFLEKEGYSSIDGGYGFNRVMNIHTVWDELTNWLAEQPWFKPGE